MIKNKKVFWCTSCVVMSTRPRISFDDKGRCSACQWAEIKKKIDWQDRQKKCKINWLNYRFQALWNFEVTEKYPFLYNFKKKKNKIIQKCVESSLMNTYFLHFAGSWYDSGHWKIKNIFLNDNFLKMYKKLIKYQKIKLKNKAHRLRIIPKGLSGVQKI